MKDILNILSRETLTELINEVSDSIKGKEETVRVSTVKRLLSTACYVYLSKFLIHADQVKLFKELISEKDIDALKTINSYNYHKLKMK